MWADRDLHFFDEWNAVIISGKVVVPNYDLVSVALGQDAYVEEATRENAGISIILNFQPLVVNVAAASDVIGVQVNCDPEANFSRWSVIYGDEVNIE